MAERLRAQRAPFKGRGYVRAAEVAAHLSVNPSWVYDHKIELGAVECDGIVVFDVGRVEAYLEAHRVRPAAAPRPTAAETRTAQAAPGVELIPLPD